MEAGDFFGESDTSGAVNTSVHMGDDQWADIFILNGSFEFVISACGESVIHGVVLQIALTTLIADWAIEWMVQKKKLHDTTSSDSGNL